MIIGLRNGFRLNHNLYQCWMGSMMPSGITKPNFTGLSAGPMQTEVYMFSFKFLRIQWNLLIHDDVIKWTQFHVLLALCAGNSLVNSRHKGQWRGALMFSLICAWINGWVNNHEAGDSRCHRAHYDITVMKGSVTTGTWYHIDGLVKERRN